VGAAALITSRRRIAAVSAGTPATTSAERS
jgi:hypothetical protein